MSISKTASKVTLPQHSTHKTVFSFLCGYFPHISEAEWRNRIQEQKVHRQDHSTITLESRYLPGEVIYYYREVKEEPAIPFEEHVVEHNDHFIIAYKPHFLPVMPGGLFVNECLQERLIKRTGIKNLQAVHRLDRHTAGLVLLSANPDTRAQYHRLFNQQEIQKDYFALAQAPASVSITGKKWHIKNYLTRGEPKFRFKNTNDHTQGQYAESIIECIGQKHEHALFKLSPITGRTHQLRLHMMEIGYPILNDRFYPVLQAKEQDDFTKPLKLLASTLSFNDPVNGKKLTFHSPQPLVD